MVFRAELGVDGRGVPAAVWSELRDSARGVVDCLRASASTGQAPVEILCTRDISITGTWLATPSSRGGSVLALVDERGRVELHRIAPNAASAARLAAFRIKRWSFWELAALEERPNGNIRLILTSDPTLSGRPGLDLITVETTADGQVLMRRRESRRKTGELPLVLPFETALGGVYLPVDDLGDIVEAVRTSRFRPPLFQRVGVLLPARQ